MLLDIVYKHKASLKIYDDTCELVNDYSSSSDFDRHARCNLGNPFLDQLKKHIVLKDSDHIMALYNLLNTTVAAISIRKQVGT